MDSNVEYPRFQETGALTRWFHRKNPCSATHVYIQPHRTVIEKQQRFVEAVPTSVLNPQPRDITKYETILTPAIRLPQEISPETEKRFIVKPIPYLEYRSNDNPLTMLFGAVIASVEKWGRMPDALFVSPLLIPLLDVQTKKATGLAFQGALRLVSENTVSHAPMIRNIPVFTEDLLPDLIKAKVWGHISRGSVIAVSEH